VSQTFPVMLDAWGPGPVFLGYAAIGVLAFVFVRALVPETKGRSLEEIEAALQRKSRVAVSA
jgi:Sugar (and other) transporter